MDSVVIYPENEDEKRNLEERVAYFKAYLIYSAIDELSISDVDKKRLLSKICNILENSDGVL